VAAPGLQEIAAWTALAAVLGWATSGLATRWLRAPGHLAETNDRSMHERPVPTQGGLAIIATVLILAQAWRPSVDQATWVVLAAAAGLAVLGWIDQHRPLWAATRFFAQGVAVAIALSMLPPDMRLLSPIVPAGAERLLLGFAWVWLINLTNFMDGIDGIAGAQVSSVSLGVLIVIWWMSGALEGSAPMLAALTLGACLGYLVWNWHPARLFMGDAGSIPLGFLTGWLLLDLARRGHVGAALVLPACFVFDATITLLRRLFSGHPPWEAHRTHFYQRAVLGGATPPGVVGWLIVANAALVIVAVLTGRDLPVALALGALVAGGWIAILASLARGRAVKPDTRGRRA
jgi:UDP-N-acetylmuramyl pentapeptide phosphotransferase/UDP-N-acetylglucosamine-1-phosphate transferase